IVKGENIPEPGIPESFKVLIKELQSLALDVKVLSEKDEEIAIKEAVDEDIDDLDVNIEGQESLSDDDLEEDEFSDEDLQDFDLDDIVDIPGLDDLDDKLLDDFDDFIETDD